MSLRKLFKEAMKVNDSGEEMPDVDTEVEINPETDEVELTTDEDFDLYMEAVELNALLEAAMARQIQTESLQFFAKESILSELSKKTLGSYIKKAHHASSMDGIDLGSHSMSSPKAQKALRKIDKRGYGVSRAVRKLTKESLVEGTKVKLYQDQAKGHINHYKVTTDGKTHLLYHNAGKYHVDNHDDPDGLGGKDHREHATVGHALGHLQKLGHDVSSRDFRHSLTEGESTTTKYHDDSKHGYHNHYKVTTGDKTHTLHHEMGRYHVDSDHDGGGDDYSQHKTIGSAIRKLNDLGHKVSGVDIRHNLEEAELNELSKNTLDSYRKKAQASHTELSKKAGDTYSSGIRKVISGDRTGQKDLDLSKKYDKKATKRGAAVFKAAYKSALKK